MDEWGCPEVLNKYKDDIPEDAVSVMRPSLWGNPFRIGIDGDRNSVCDKHIKAIDSDPFLISEIKRELKGKDLVCCCAPERCHADHLLKIANV